MKHICIVTVCLLVLSQASWSQDTPGSEGTQSTEDTVTVSREEFESLKAAVAELQQLLKRETPPQPAGLEPSDEASDTDTGSAYATSPAQSDAGGRHLTLPDISLIVQAKGKATTDGSDPAKQKLQLTEAELGIQGFVYPNVKADAFVAGSPSEDEAFQVEEAYLTYLGLAKGLSVNIGEKHVPFGRSNLLHNHSWLYARQPLVISNFVASESLAGQGVNVSYLLPTKSDLFAQLDLGVWANGTEGEQSGLPDIVAGPGANLTDRFVTARLWTGYPVSERGELELGGSWAGGKSNEDPVTLDADHVHLTGVDLGYRHFGEGDERLLLRGEYFRRTGITDSNGDTAEGYYLFGNFRKDKYSSVGLLLDWSEFPQATNLHESALSLIYTKQFSEQYYLRLQATHGSRPDCGGFNELWLQWVWGVGPHTHNLE
jgi:hypothetical protein